MNRPVRMQDIAEALGVAKSTVCRGLQGHPKCGPALRAKILAKADELGYRPDPLQRVHMAQLRGGRVADGTVIGMLDLYNSDWSIERNPSNRRFAIGARNRAEELGMALEIFSPLAESYDLERLRRILFARNIRGLIIPPLPQAHTHLDFDFSGISAVAIAYTLEAPDLHRVSHNHYAVTWAALEYLHGVGKSRVGLAISDSMQERVGQRWHAAHHEFYRSCRKANPASSFTFDSNDDERQARRHWFEPFCTWIEQNQLNAVLGIDPWMVKALKWRGWRVPEEVTYLDMDWYAGKAQIPSNCPVVNQNFEGIAAAAVDEIAAMWGRREYGIPTQPKSILLAGSIQLQKAFCVGKSNPWRNQPTPHSTHFPGT